MNIIQKMNEETEQLKDTAWTSTLQAVTRAATLVRDLARIAGRNNIRIPAGSTTTVDTTGYRCSLPGEDSCVLVEPLKDQTHHSILQAPSPLFVENMLKYKKMSGFAHEFPVSRRTIRTSTSHNSSSMK